MGTAKAMRIPYPQIGQRPEPRLRATQVQVLLIHPNLVGMGDIHSPRLSGGADQCHPCRVCRVCQGCQAWECHPWDRLILNKGQIQEDGDPPRLLRDRCTPVCKGTEGWGCPCLGCILIRGCRCRLVVNMTVCKVEERGRGWKVVCLQTGQRIRVVSEDGCRSTHGILARLGARSP